MSFKLDWLPPIDSRFLCAWYWSRLEATSESLGMRVEMLLTGRAGGGIFLLREGEGEGGVASSEEVEAGNLKSRGESTW